MSLPSFVERIPSRYWALVIMLIWGAAALLLDLMRFDLYGIDEGATRALMLNWSVVDQMAHPVVVFGMPDFRALLFVPLGVYWSGSIIAAKVFTLMASFCSVWLLFNWCKETQSDEVAMIGSGLMLIAPITLMQADAIGVGPYLLMVMGFVRYVETRYRAQSSSITGLYFTLMLLVATAVTLHPAGLAVPAALMLRWFAEPISTRRRNQVFAGIGITVVVILAMRAGWTLVPWLQNPLPALGTALFGHDSLELISRGWEFGIVPFVLLIVVLVMDWKFLSQDLLGSMLALGALIGFFAADAAWAMLVVTLLLYRGTTLLIKANSALHVHNFFGQRGIVLIVLFIVSTLFMQIDKEHARHNALGMLSAEDELIHTLSQETAGADDKLRIATQWPGRTMLATKRAALPLPPAQEDTAVFLKQIKGLTHIMFAHNDPRNAALSHNLAQIGGLSETLALQPGGVIVKLRIVEPEPASAAPAEAPASPSTGTAPSTVVQ